MDDGMTPDDPSPLQLGLAKQSASLFYTFLAALEDRLRAGDTHEAAFAHAKAHTEKECGECPFSGYVKSCASCRHFDRGHCHRWAADVPAEAVEAGCGGHEFVVPAVLTGEEPF